MKGGANFTMATKDYYDVLGVKQNATQDEIKQAFHKLARKYHPDAGGDEKKFKEVSEAYDTLGNEQKRREYDQMRAFGGMPGAGYANYSGGSGFSWADIFNDMGTDGGSGIPGFDFSSIYGAAQANRARRGSDITATVVLTFDEAFHGVKKKLTYRIRSTNETQTLMVDFPAGSKDGGKLRFRNRGELGRNGGTRGDLIVTTKVENSSIFKRDGADVRMDLPLSIYEAALGTSVEVPTPDGTSVRLKIPAGTQDGKTFRFRNLGAPNLERKGSRGALYVKVQVQVPTNLSAAEKSNLQQLMDEDERDYRAALEMQTR